MWISECRCCLWKTNKSNLTSCGSMLGMSQWNPPQASQCACDCLGKFRQLCFLPLVTQAFVWGTLCQPKKLHRNAFSSKGFIQKKLDEILWISNCKCCLEKINPIKLKWCDSMSISATTKIAPDALVQLALVWLPTCPDNSEPIQ